MNGIGNAKAKPFSKHTFCKEVIAVASQAGKNDWLAIIASVFKCTRASISNKQATEATRVADSETDSDESMNNWKLQFPGKSQQN